MTAPVLSIVIPMFDEEPGLPALLGRLLTVLRGLDCTWEVLCVNDGSRDRTADLIRAAQRDEPRLVLVDLARNFGQHAAVTAGFAHAQGAFIITLDADLQNPPEEIPNLLAQWRRGHDLVHTIRRDRQDTWFRRTASRAANRLVRRMSGIQLQDFGCMQRGYSAEVAAQVVRCREHRTFIPALATCFARNPVEITVGHAHRAEGVSKYPLRRLLAIQCDLITGFSLHPLRPLFVIGSGCVALGVGLALLPLLGRCWQQTDRSWDLTLVVLGAIFLVGGLQFLAFGLLGEYLGRVLQQVHRRDPWVVRAVERRDGGPVQPQDAGPR